MDCFGSLVATVRAQEGLPNVIAKLAPATPGAGRMESGVGVWQPSSWDPNCFVSGNPFRNRPKCKYQHTQNDHCMTIKNYPSA